MLFTIGKGHALAAALNAAVAATPGSASEEEVRHAFINDNTTPTTGNAVYVIEGSESPLDNVVLIDDSRVELSQLGKETIRHAGLFLFQGQTAESLKGNVTNENWTPEKIAGALTESLLHFQNNSDIQELAQEYQNGDTSQFEKFTTDAGHTTQSAVESIDKMFDEARDAVKNAVDGEIRKVYENVYDRGIQSLILLVKDDAAYEQSVLRALGNAKTEDQEATGLQATWHAGFQLFVENSLKPFLEGASTAPQNTVPPKSLPGFNKN